MKLENKYTRVKDTLEKTASTACWQIVLRDIPLQKMAFRRAQLFTFFICTTNENFNAVTVAGIRNLDAVFFVIIACIPVVPMLY